MSQRPSTDTRFPPPSVRLSQEEWEQLEQWQREGCWREHNTPEDDSATVITTVSDKPIFPLVRFFPGTGGEVWLPVSHISNYARGPNGTCAFCNGDPCNERSAPDSPIARFYVEARHANTCPFCLGRPS